MPLTALTTEERESLIKTVTRSYRNPSAFAAAVFAATGERLVETLDLHQGLRTFVAEAVDQAEGGDWLEALVHAARRGVPGNRPMQALADRLGAPPLPLALPTPPSPSAPSSAALQAVVRQRLPAVNMARFVARLQAASRAVCWIGLDGRAAAAAQLGSGFLVAPDLVLTNAHVIGPATREEADPATILFRFDHLAPDGDGPTARLAAGWCLDTLPPAPSDEAADGRAPKPDELDFALLQLDRPIGTQDGRGWLPLAPLPAMLADDLVHVVQHPAEDGGEQRIASGVLLGFEGPAALRVRYDASTLPGSSGSPVLNAELQVAALHHGTQPLLDLRGNQIAAARTFNRGIPLRAVMARLASRGLGDAVSVAP